jgi:hypothetical protein
MKSWLSALLVLAALPAAAADEPETIGATIMSTAHEVGVLAPGEREARRTFLLDAAARVTFVVASSAPYDAEVVFPDGTVLSAATAEGDQRRWLELQLEQTPQLALPGMAPGANTVAMIESPPPGPYEVRLRARQEAAEPTPFVFTMLPESEVRVGILLPQSQALAGQAVPVSVLAFEGARPLLEADVRASVVYQPEDPRAERGRPRRLVLEDRGAAGDARRGDGAFGGVFVPEQAGRYWVDVRVKGRSRAGYDFQRDVGGVVTVGPAAEILSEEVEIQTFDTDDNGLFDRLRVVLWGRFPAGGLYDTVVQLRGENGRTVTAHALEAGVDTLAVDFTGSQVRSLQCDGPWTIASVQVDEVTESGRLVRDRRLEVGRSEYFPMERGLWEE